MLLTLFIVQLWRSMQCWTFHQPFDYIHVFLKPKVFHILWDQFIIILTLTSLTGFKNSWCLTKEPSTVNRFFSQICLRLKFLAFILFRTKLRNSPLFLRGSIKKIISLKDFSSKWMLIFCLNDLRISKLSCNVKILRLPFIVLLLILNRLPASRKEVTIYLAILLRNMVRYRVEIFQLRIYIISYFILNLLIQLNLFNCFLALFISLTIYDFFQKLRKIFHFIIIFLSTCNGKLYLLSSTRRFTSVYIVLRRIRLYD